MKKLFKNTWLLFVIVFLAVSCKIKNQKVLADDIKAINLKRGQVVECGNSDNKLGSVTFEVSCSGKVKDDFNLAVELLHSFEYDEASSTKSLDVPWHTGELPCAIFMRYGHRPQNPNLKKGPRQFVLPGRWAVCRKENQIILKL